MGNIEIIREATAVLKSAGYLIRQDWFGGEGGGRCKVRGQNQIFLDLAQAPQDQLEVLLAAIREDENIDPAGLSSSLQAAVTETEST